MSKTAIAVKEKEIFRQLNSTVKQLDPSEVMSLLHKAEDLLNKKNINTSNEKIRIVESDCGKNFRIFLGHTPKVFVLHEMRKMVKLCHDSITPVKGASRLKIWLKNNRPDFFLDHKIGNDWDQSLQDLYFYLINNYIA